MMPKEVVQQFNMKIKTLCHNPLGDTFLLLTLLYMLLLLNPAHSRPVFDVQKRQTPRQEELRTECHRSNSTCDFYSHCIEPSFPCGNTGFVLDHAQKRCQQLAKLKHDPIMTWAHNSELCFQRKLYNLVNQYRDSSSTPAPSTCLRLEREAIDEMNNCYNMNNSLCETILADNSESTQQELQRVMEAVRVGGDYYDSVVDRGVPEAVHQCGHIQLAQSLQTQVLNQRVIICAFAQTSQNILDIPSFITTELSEALDVPHHQFVYSGIDEENICQIRAPNGFNQKEFDDSDWEFHFFTWFTDRTNPVIASDNITKFKNEFATEGAISYFELNYYSRTTEPQGIRDISTCGDGIRQAGEECDYSGVEVGCNFTCAVVTNDNGFSYDCSTERLQPSTCWIEICGDGARTSHETCDDGNTMDGDGCSSNCKIEASYRCTSEYNTTSQCSLIPTLPPPTASRLPLSTHSTSEKVTSSPSLNTMDNLKQQPLSLNSGASSSMYFVRTSLLSVLLTTFVALCVISSLLTHR